MVNEPQPDQPHQEPKITGAEIMPASLGSIKDLRTEITRFLIESNYENETLQRTISIKKDQQEIQTKFPDLQKVVAIESEHSRPDEGMTHLFLYFPKHIIEYHIRRYYKSGLMDIEKVIELPTDPEEEKRLMSYEERAARMLSSIQAGMLEEDTGMRSVSLQETRDLTWLVSRLNLSRA